MLPRMALHSALQLKRSLRQVMWVAGHQPKAQLPVHLTGWICGRRLRRRVVRERPPPSSRSLSRLPVPRSHLWSSVSGTLRAFSLAASRVRNGPTRRPSWAGCRKRLSWLTVYRVRRPVRGEVTGGFQVGHDGLDGAFGQSHDGADIPDPQAGCGRSPKHAPVPGQERPELPPLLSGSPITPDHITRGRKNARFFSCFY